MGKQTLVVRIDGQVARTVDGFLAKGGHGYESLDEFVQVALRNQLAMEAATDDPAGTVSQRPTAAMVAEVLTPPAEPIPESLAEPTAPSGDRLFVLTNRLSPIKVAARTLAWAGVRGAWPSLEAFQEEAARAARDLGLRLRAEDLAADRSGPARRWIAYPVGEDERAALARFIASFTMQAGENQAIGPMAILGLANIRDGRAQLTEAGWRLATARSPLMDGAQGLTLSREEADLLKGCVLRAPGELVSVREFLEVVKRAAGQQPRIDELLAARFSDWTETLTVAHRSALIGRLGDLGLLEVSGRGPKAQITLLPAANEFLNTATTVGVA